jgi:hypothetical protein
MRAELGTAYSYRGPPPRSFSYAALQLVPSATSCLSILNSASNLCQGLTHLFSTITPPYVPSVCQTAHTQTRITAANTFYQSKDVISKLFPQTTQRYMLTPRTI